MDEKKIKELIEKEVNKSMDSVKQSEKNKDRAFESKEKKIEIKEPVKEVDAMNGNDFKEILKEMNEKTNEAIKNLDVGNLFPKNTLPKNQFNQQTHEEKKLANDFNTFSMDDFHKKFMSNLKDLESNMEGLAKEIESFENMEKKEIQNMEREKDKDKLLVKELVEKRSLLEINGPVFISVRRYREVVDLTQRIGNTIYQMQEMVNRILETRQESVRDLEKFVEEMKELEDSLSSISEIMKLN